MDIRTSRWSEKNEVQLINTDFLAPDLVISITWKSFKLDSFQILIYNNIRTQIFIKPTHGEDFLILSDKFEFTAR